LRLIYYVIDLFGGLHISLAIALSIYLKAQAEQMATKISDGSCKTAPDILKEARDNGYGTIVLGGRGISALKEFFLGIVTAKILYNSFGLTVWIV
jgi:nucleotide-binding universal stress UspA family protein